MSGAGSSGATGATMTALNIFMKMCREEHKEMFPEEQLGTLLTYLHLLQSFRFRWCWWSARRGIYENGVLVDWVAWNKWEKGDS